MIAPVIREYLVAALGYRASRNQPREATSTWRSHYWSDGKGNRRPGPDPKRQGDTHIVDCTTCPMPHPALALTPTGRLRKRQPGPPKKPTVLLHYIELPPATRAAAGGAAAHVAGYWIGTCWECNETMFMEYEDQEARAAMAS